MVHLIQLFSNCQLKYSCSSCQGCRKQLLYHFLFWCLLGKGASCVSKATPKAISRLFSLTKCRHQRKVPWGMCVRDLLPSCGCLKRSKLISKSFRVRCTTVPDVKVQLTIQPWGIKSEVKPGEPTFTALEVTVVKPPYHYRAAQLHLELDIVMQSGKKLVCHRINHALQSFFVPNFASHEHLQQLPSTGKLSVHILSYVIPDREVNMSQFEFVNKSDCTVDCSCLC